MKYYHVIYNSSQKGMKGSVGFGIRTVTEGTPQEYLEALTQQEVFAFRYSNAASLTPAVLINEVNKIKEVPPTYFYTVINISADEKIYVLGRKIAVGFDYTYYMNYKAGRLGNYVVDCYIFNEPPGKDIFELLYESPKQGGNYFLPSTPVPSETNEDMKYLSLGHVPTIEKEEKSFNASTVPTLSTKCVEILFAYIESQIKQKPLFIKAPTQITANLIADFYRLLPAEIASKITFCSNYQEDGIKQGYQIFFINEYFPFEVYKNLYVYANLIDNEFVQSKESEIFKKQIEENIQSENWLNIHNKVKWMLSEEFKQVRDLSADTNTEFYNYCIEPSLFHFNKLISNNELRKLMTDYFRRNPKNQEKLNLYVQQLFTRSDNATDIYQKAVRYIQSLSEINFDTIISANKERVTAMILATPEAVRDFLELTSLDSIKSFINQERFFEKNAYLSSFPDKWETLFPYFLQSPQKNLTGFIQRTYDDGLAPSMREKVIAKVESNADIVLDSCLTLLKKEGISYEESLLDQIKKIIQNPQITTQKSLVREFKNRIDSPSYAPLFYWQIKQASSFSNPLSILDYLANLMERNATLKQLIVKGFDQDRIYAKCYESIKSQLSSKKLEKDKVSECIGGKVLDVLRNDISEKVLSNWIILSDILANASDELNSKEKVMKAFNIALEIHDNEYLKTIFPKVLSIKVSDEETISGIVNKLMESKLYPHSTLFREVKSSPDRDLYWKVLFKLEESKDVKRMLDKLAENGLNEKERDIFMLNYFPKRYHRYQKSLEPSFFAKIIQFFSKKPDNKQQKEK